MKRALTVIALMLLCIGAAWMIDEKPFSKAKEDDTRVLSILDISGSAVIKVCEETGLDSEEDGALFFATAINEIYPYLKDSTGYDKSLALIQDIKDNTDKHFFYIFTKSRLGYVKMSGGKRNLMIESYTDSTVYSFFESNKVDRNTPTEGLPDGLLFISPEKIAKLIRQQ